MASKYGEPLNPEPWKGWALRVGQFPGQGKLEALVAAEDALLVWSGGRSDVTLHARREQQTERHRFLRQPGMIDLLPKGTVLEEIDWRGEASECVSVSFDAQGIERAFGKRVALPTAELRTALTDPHVFDLVRRLREQALTGQPWGSFYVEALSLTLASYVYGRYGGPAKPGDDTPSLPVHTAERLVAFVDDHLGDNITLTRLAALAGYSPDHFARLFKHSFGRSPYQYVLERRVERAKALLRANEGSIAEVAVLCGFGSQAHLHAAFKARTGVTPGSYRKSRA